MKPMTVRGLDNSIRLLITTPEFERIRCFLTADASQGSGESEEIVKFAGDKIRAHLLAHGKAVQAIAAAKRAV